MLRYSATPTAAAPSLDLDASLRAELARSWTEQALMEHASVAAFARFSLQLSSPVSQPVPPSSLDRELLRRGVVSVGLRRALRERVLGEVIAPCARALLEQAQPAESIVLHERASLAQQA